MTPKTKALLSAVLPQDFIVKNVTDWDAAAAAQRRHEGRLVGRVVMAGIFAGGVMGYFVGQNVPVGIFAGGGVGLLAGWSIVGWQRHQAGA